MKDKAEVLLELERLTVVKEELTEEVANLHKLLEQERSNKNPQHASQTDVHAKHTKEKVGFFVAFLCVFFLFILFGFIAFNLPEHVQE